MLAQTFRLRKHADYQKVYQSSRKQSAGQMSYFFTLRPAREDDPARNNADTAALPPAEDTPAKLKEDPTPGSRIGLTVGRVMGKAVDRNRIKRRMREAVRLHLDELALPVDVVLHPRRTVLDVDFAILERDIAHVFRNIARSARSGTPPPPPLPRKPHKPKATSSHAQAKQQTPKQQAQDQS